MILKGGTAPSEDAAKFDEVAMQCGIMERLDESQREAFFVVSKNEFIVVQGSGEPYGRDSSAASDSGDDAGDATVLACWDRQLPE